MTELNQRMASLGDIEAIWNLMKQASADIPVDLASEAAQENMLTELMACCTSGLSPIVVDGKSAVVGALLVRRSDFDWGFYNGDAVHMSCAAVAPSHRDKGVLRDLVAQVQQRNVPILASVKDGNQLKLADELQGLGFAHECAAASGWGDLYKWKPAASVPEPKAA